MQAFLLFSHQLFPEVAQQPRHTVIYLIEDARLFRAGANPALAVFHRAALQAIRERLLVKGFVVQYMGADEYPKLDMALETLANQHPEVVRFYELGDANLKKQLESLLKAAEIPFLVLPSSVPTLKLPQRGSFVPTILPPIEPNRYVEEAAQYFLDLVPTDTEIVFAYPVTRGDTEEWRELLPELIEQGEYVSELAHDLVPLLMAGLIDLAMLEADLAQVSPERWLTFRRFLVG